MIERSWVESRLERVPASLRARMTEVLGAQSDGPVTAAALRAAAEGLLQDVVARGEKADPGDLLAADALVTLACEAASEFDPERLAEIR
jgi:hypothetical protein